MTQMYRRRGLIAAAVLLACSAYAAADVPLVFNHQGLVRVDGTNAPFNGTGNFKFGILNGSNQYIWKNDTGTVTATTTPPANSIGIAVSNGIYSLRLGDTTLGANMKAIQSGIFQNTDLKLRVFFEGEQLSPDQPLSSVPYAIAADTAVSVRGYLEGGIISNASGDPDNDLTISAVVCRDDSDSVNIKVVTLIKRVDAVFSAGNNAGGLDSGAAESDAVYYVWAIGSKSGAVAGDILLSKSGTGPQMPSGYDAKRLLGGRVRSGGAFKRFWTVGAGRDRWVYYNLPIKVLTDGMATTATTVDLAGSTPSSTCQLIDLSAVVTRTSAGTSADLYVLPWGATGADDLYSFARIQGASGTLRVTGNGYVPLVNGSKDAYWYFLSSGCKTSHYLRGYLENL